jgi:hypothetical protein
MKRFALVLAGLSVTALALPMAAWPQEKPPAAPPQAAGAVSEERLAQPAIVEGMLAQSSSEPGFMDSKHVKDLLDQTRFAEYRINDLLTDVHPERWKIPDNTRSSFNAMVEAMHTQMKALHEWRNQFAARPGSAYLGFETYTTIGTILPRLQGVAQIVSKADNASFGAQFYQASDRLYALQQKLGSYLGFLLNNQDSIAHALESNLAACQSQLGQAMQSQKERPKWMRNSAPVRARRTRVKPRPMGSSEKEKKPAAQPPAQKP